MSKKIKGRDGLYRYEPDSYVLADGEALCVAMAMMDGLQKAVAASSPQSLADAFERRDRAYANSVRRMSNEWTGKPDEAPPRKPASEMTIDQLNDRRDESYRKFVDDLSNAWRGEAA